MLSLAAMLITYAHSDKVNVVGTELFAFISFHEFFDFKFCLKLQYLAQNFAVKLIR